MGRSLLAALISGLVFGVGLALAGMLNPAKVTGFLDIFGLWDPSLAFVMAGGIAVNMGGYLLFVKGRKPLFSSSFKLPQTAQIDRPLLLGSALFGFGWGMAGLCPGPVVSSLLLNPVDMIIFVLIMCAGLKTGAVLKQRL